VFGKAPRVPVFGWINLRVDRAPPSPGVTPGDAETRWLQEVMGGSVPISTSQRVRCPAVTGASQQGPERQHVHLHRTTRSMAQPGASPHRRTVPRQSWHGGSQGQAWGCSVHRGLVPRERQHPRGWGSAEAKAGEEAEGDKKNREMFYAGRVPER